MMKPDTIIIDGHAFSWQRLTELRRQQLEAWNAARLRQLALFELREDCRPSAERTATGRYHEPTLFGLLASAAIPDRRARPVMEGVTACFFARLRAKPCPATPPGLWPALTGRRFTA